MRNNHGICLGDVFMFSYCGINVFLKVCAITETTATVYELETYKYKDTNKIFNKWKVLNPDKKVSHTGWAEMLRTSRREKKPANCSLVPLGRTNSLTKPSLTLKTAYRGGAPTIYVPISVKTRLYWEAKKIKELPPQGIICAKAIIRSDDKHSEKVKQLNLFYPYINPEKNDSEEVEA
jgi:hypothetical protein